MNMPDDYRPQTAGDLWGTTDVVSADPSVPPIAYETIQTWADPTAHLIKFSYVRPGEILPSVAYAQGVVLIKDMLDPRSFSVAGRKMRFNTPYLHGRSHTGSTILVDARLVTERVGVRIPGLDTEPKPPPRAACTHQLVYEQPDGSSLCEDCGETVQVPA
jgi:hypothetical protein